MTQKARVPLLLKLSLGSMLLCQALIAAPYLVECHLTAISDGPGASSYTPLTASRMVFEKKYYVVARKTRHEGAEFAMAGMSDSNLIGYTPGNISFSATKDGVKTFMGSLDLDELFKWNADKEVVTDPFVLEQATKTDPNTLSVRGVCTRTTDRQLLMRIYNSAGNEK